LPLWPYLQSRLRARCRARTARCGRERPRRPAQRVPPHGSPPAHHRPDRRAGSVIRRRASERCQYPYGSGWPSHGVEPGTCRRWMQQPASPDEAVRSVPCALLHTSGAQIRCWRQDPTPGTLPSRAPVELGSRPPKRLTEPRGTPRAWSRALSAPALAARIRGDGHRPGHGSAHRASPRWPGLGRA
jgi:hypothetical protein